MQHSLVSHYGEKPDHLVHLISRLQDLLSKQLSAAFTPYAMQQVHGTILGMETELTADAIYSRWYTQNKGVSRPIDFKNLLLFLQNDLPEIPIRIGGYQPQQDYGFSSRDQHPYLRSFSIQGSIAVAMGWPVMRSGHAWVYSNALYRLRQAFEAFHLCHKWNTGTYQDNDFFFVLGKVDQEAVAPEFLERVLVELRQLLVQEQQVILVGSNSLALVAYEDTALPLNSTLVFSLKNRNLSEQRLKEIWRSSTTNIWVVL